jgi:hypothetical protein
MTIIKDTVIDGAGNPIQGANVIIRLVNGRGSSALKKNIISTAKLKTDANGYWQADVLGNDQMDGTTQYKIQYNIRGRRLRMFKITVPSAGGPYWMYQFPITATPAVPGPPQNLVATPGSPGQIGLVWEAPSYSGTSAVTNYVIERNTGSGFGSIATVSSGTLTFTDAVGVGVTASYRIAAINAVGTGPYSVAATATATGGPTVTNTTVVISDYKQVAPNNSRGIETTVIYDTDIAAFNTPAGNIIYLDPINGNDANAGTSLAPVKTPAVAKTKADASGVNTTILVRYLGAGEYIIRDYVPRILSSSKVVCIQPERGAKIVWSGCDIFASANWTYVSGKGWEWQSPYTPQLTRVAGNPPPDQVFVDNVPYTQSATSNPGPGQFYVDLATNKLYLGEASGWAIGSHVIEVSVRAYSAGSGLNNDRHNKNSFKLRGFAFRGWAGDYAKDFYAAVMFGGAGSSLGQNQVLEYCTFAYNANQAFDWGQTTSLTVSQVVFQNQGNNHGHADGATGALFNKVRFNRANWELAYDYAPGATERTAGVKVAHDVNGIFSECLFMNNACNALWHDVHCVNAKVYTTTFMDNLGYGYTQENGGTLLMADLLFLRNGNTSFFNRDGFRVAGCKDARLYNITSVDNVGAAMFIVEYDISWGTSTSNPVSDGDTVNMHLRNCVRVTTSRAMTEAFWSVNSKPAPANGISFPGQVNQIPAYTTEQMMSPDPFASGLTPQMDWNVTIQINRQSGRQPYKWATPTANFTGTQAQWGASTAMTLATVQGRGCEANSKVVQDSTDTDANLLTKYFPSRATNDWSWKALTTVPGTSGTVSCVGTVPPDDVCDILGIAHGATAKVGYYNAPVPVYL